MINEEKIINSIKFSIRKKEAVRFKLEIDPKR